MEIWPKMERRSGEDRLHHVRRFNAYVCFKSTLKRRTCVISVSSRVEKNANSIWYFSDSKLKILKTKKLDQMFKFSAKK